MSTMNISLPKSFRAFVEERVESGGYSTSSEYLRDLIRRDYEKYGKLVGEIGIKID